MLFQNFPCWPQWMPFPKLLGIQCSMISTRSAWHKPDSLEKDSTSFGRRTFCPLCNLKAVRMYSSFATSNSWNTFFGVYMRAWKIHTQPIWFSIEQLQWFHASFHFTISFQSWYRKMIGAIWDITSAQDQHDMIVVKILTKMCLTWCVFSQEWVLWDVFSIKKSFMGLLATSKLAKQATFFYVGWITSKILQLIESSFCARSTRSRA